MRLCLWNELPCQVHRGHHHCGCGRVDPALDLLDLLHQLLVKLLLPHQLCSHCLGCELVHVHLGLRWLRDRSEPQRRRRCRRSGSSGGHRVFPSILCERLCCLLLEGILGTPAVEGICRAVLQIFGHGCGRCGVDLSLGGLGSPTLEALVLVCKHRGPALAACPVSGPGWFGKRVVTCQHLLEEAPVVLDPVLVGHHSSAPVSPRAQPVILLRRPHHPGTSCFVACHVAHVCRILICVLALPMGPPVCHGVHTAPLLFFLDVFNHIQGAVVFHH